MRQAGRQQNNVMWMCHCSCGKTVEVRSTRLRKGEATSCGCDSIRGNTRHRKCKTRIYSIWKSMKQRCTDPNSTNYPKYGARGITVSEQWVSFDNFYLDMGDPPSPSHSLERLDNNLGYCKDNCTWATASEQGRNKRNNVFLTLNGRTQTQSEWAKELGLHPTSLAYRLKRGWPLERVLSR
jgi:hypothetical protein